MKTIATLLGSILISTLSFGQEEKPVKEYHPNLKRAEKTQTTLQPVSAEDQEELPGIYVELGLDPQTTTDAELKEALRELHYSDPAKYKEINKKYLNTNGRQKGIEIKRADFEAMPEEKQKVILNNPIRYTIVD